MEKLDTSGKDKKFAGLVDQFGKPYDENNLPAGMDKEAFKAEPYNKPEKKPKKETIDLSLLKASKQKVADLNERYLSSTQREEKALLYSQLEEAQKEHQRLAEESNKSSNMTERDRKIAKLEALREEIKNLNEKYLSEMQREQKAILYSQLEQAQKQYRKLEEELDSTVPKKKTEGESEKSIGDEVIAGAIAEKVAGSHGGGHEGGDHGGGHEDGATKAVPAETPKPKDDAPTPPPSSPEFNKASLDAMRDQYLQAKRLRGNVFRGGLGRLFGRTLNFGGNNQPGAVLFAGEKMDFGGKNGALELERVRNEYQEGLAQYRRNELEKLQTSLSARVTSGEITPAQANLETRERMMSLLQEEQGNIDARAVEGIEKNIFEKMKTKWRQYTGTRFVTGLLLGGGAALTGGTAIGAGLVGVRAGMGAVGTYVGVEAGLERYSKLIGHKNGLVRRIASEKRNFTTADGLEKYMATLPEEEIRKEAARLRMLQVEKGVAIGKLNTLGDDGTIAARIIERDNQISAREAFEGRNAGETPADFANRLSGRLATQINWRNELVESEVDKERLKKMARKTTAVLAGGAAGWLIGGKLFDKPGDIDLSSGSQSPDMPATPKPPTPDLPKPIEPLPPPSFVPTPPHIVTEGENTWKIIEGRLDSKDWMKGLGEAERTHVIDELKDKLAKLSPNELKSLGWSSGDINMLKPGDALDLSGIENVGTVLQALDNSSNLTPEQMASIVENNRKIALWLAEHKGELKGPLNSSMIEDILRGAPQTPDNAPMTLNTELNSTPQAEQVSADMNRLNREKSEWLVREQLNKSYEPSPSTEVVPGTPEDFGVKTPYAQYEELNKNWERLKNLDARKIMRMKTEDQPGLMTDLSKYIQKLSEVSELKPKGGFWSREESVQNFTTRALDKIRQAGNLDKLK